MGSIVIIFLSGTLSNYHFLVVNLIFNQKSVSLLYSWLIWKYIPLQSVHFLCSRGLNCNCSKEYTILFFQLWGCVCAATYPTFLLWISLKDKINYCFCKILFHHRSQQYENKNKQQQWLWYDYHISVDIRFQIHSIFRIIISKYISCFAFKNCYGATLFQTILHITLSWNWPW